MSIMSEVVKVVAVAITNATPSNVDPDLYSVVMDASPTFSTRRRWYVALSHLFDNRAQGNGFVQMDEDQRELWLRTFMSKHYYV
jgi:hypothetical protein